MTHEEIKAWKAIHFPQHRKPELYTYNGQSLTMREWADKLQTNPMRIYKRLSRGWSLERALTQGMKGKI